MYQPATFIFTKEELKYFINSIVNSVIKDSVVINNTFETPNRKFLFNKALNETAKEFNWQKD